MAVRLVDFNPFGNESLVVKFDCDQCGEKIVSDEIPIPGPDYMAESHGDSYNHHDEDVFCDGCEKVYTVTLYVGVTGGYLDVNNLDERADVDIIENQEPYYDEEIDDLLESEETPWNIFATEIGYLRAMLDVSIDYSFERQGQEDVMLRMIYASAIGSLEYYLYSMLVIKILDENDDKCMKRFVETNKGFNDQKFSLSKIYLVSADLRNKVKIALQNVTYHRLDKVRNFYKDAINVKFPDIEPLMEIISKRHHIVHRMGRDKDGGWVDRDPKKVEGVLNAVEEFVTDIQKQIDPSDLRPPKYLGQHDL